MDEFGINSGYVAELLDRYLQDPNSVDESWRAYFATRVPARNVNGNGHAIFGVVAQPVMLAPAESAGARNAQALQGRVSQLIDAYRTRGHLYANLDPLGVEKEDPRELDLKKFELGEEHLDWVFSTVDMAGPKTATLREIIERLRTTYCRSIGVEFSHIENPEQRRWLQERMEATLNRLVLTPEEQIRILSKLTDAETLEQFIHKNYVGSKRFSLEGGESLIPMIDLLIETAGASGVEEIVIGMAHRGRLNVLVNILHKNVREIFAAFEDKDPEKFLARGDVKYHLGYSHDHVTAAGQTVHLTLAFNPSHLEWVNPVVEGRVRAKQDRRADANHKRVLPLVIHGDAAFMGQGVVAETLNLANLDGYTTGGTVHIVVNNQIGFTTDPRDSRSTHYSTDISRILKAPVFHVNGEDPEAVGQVTKLAAEYRQLFGQDVVIDLYCYRRYGHNEGDEPRFTQPLMYRIVDQKPTIREQYVQHLLSLGHLTTEQADEMAKRKRAALDKALDEARRGGFEWVRTSGGGLWAKYSGGRDGTVADVPTAVSRERLLELGKLATRLPEGFTLHPKLAKVLDTRIERLEKGLPVDWATGEMLAYATLLSEGTRIRLSGQDARRGTFAHRHATLRDVTTGQRYTPLANMGEGFAPFEVFDSPLSEAAVLGFEYGYSLDAPDSLVIWEAQFGDFANTAQVIIDQFLVSGEAKWDRLSGLVLYLPHGYEGMGPEHSSARPERFLQMCADDNIQVCALTTPAQLFHALRRQILKPWRKPLVLFTPKSKLREQNATIDDFTSGSFQRVIGDSQVAPEDVKKILLCSGRVYFDLAAMRQKLGRDDIAIVRLEQLYPLSNELVEALAPYKDGTPLVWVQDEPFNMGAWYFLNARLPSLLGTRLPLSCVSRAEHATPATGSQASHQLEQKRLLDAAFG